MNLFKPNDRIIKKYIKKFKQDKRYSLGDKIINKLIVRFPSNKRLDEVFVKVSVINELYSTNIFATFRMATHIVGLSNLDNLISRGSSQAVIKIATGHNIIANKTNEEFYFYSFATKYCNWHNQEVYPLYDQYVEKILMAYNKKVKFSNFILDDLKDYNEFKRIISDFRIHYSLQNHGLKVIDKFLWMYGKHKFKK